MPPKIKLVLYRGDDTAQLFSLTQDGTPYDTSQIARLDLHAVADVPSFGGKSKPEKVLNLSSDDNIQVISKGKILVNFSHDLTADATWTRANFDLQATLTDGRIKTLVQGTITLTHDTTQ